MTSVTDTISRESLGRGTPLLDDEPKTLAELFVHAARKHDRPNALNFKKDGEWKAISSSEMIERAEAIALGLYALGLRKGDKAAILAANAPDWTLVDAGCQFAGVIDVPIYTTQAVEQIRFILENSGARMLFISGKKLWKHAESAIQSVEQIEKIIFFDADEREEGDSRAITLSDVETAGDAHRKIDSEIVERSLSEILSDDLATIIYTSGTTGEPKGVMLTHENFVSNVVAVSKGLPIRPTDRSLAVLPLSHIFERTVFYVQIGRAHV